MPGQYETHIQHCIIVGIYGRKLISVVQQTLGRHVVAEGRAGQVCLHIAEVLQQMRDKLCFWYSKTSVDKSNLKVM